MQPKPGMKNCAKIQKTFLDLRRHLKNGCKANNAILRQPNKAISRSAKHNVRAYNKKHISKFFEDNKSLRVLHINLIEARKRISKLSDKNGNTETNKAEIFKKSFTKNFMIYTKNSKSRIRRYSRYIF